MPKSLLARCLTALAIAAAIFTGAPAQAVAVTRSLSINDVTLIEGNSGVTDFNFTVMLSQPAYNWEVNFDIYTVESSANAGSDYIYRSEHIDIPPLEPWGGWINFTFTVEVFGDLQLEPNEFFWVEIINLVGATPGDTLGLGTIVNDDIGRQPPSVPEPGSLALLGAAGVAFTLAQRRRRPGAHAQ